MTTSTLDIVRANFTRRTEIQGELRSIDEAATTDQRAYTEDESGKITELRSELEAIDDRITSGLELEARSQHIEAGMGELLGAMIDRDSGDVVDTRSIGQQFAELEEYRSWVDAGARGTSPALNAEAEFRAVTDLTTTTALVNPQRLGRIGQDFLDRRTFLLDFLPAIPVGTGSIEYVQDSSPLADMANKPAERTEGAAAAQGGITPALISEATATISVWTNITRQAAADAPQMGGYLDGRMRYAIKRRADAQAIAGNGTAPNLRGLSSRSGIVTYAPGSAEDRAKSIRRGIRLGEDAEAVYEIIVLNPADAEIFDLTNYGTAGLHANGESGGLSAGGSRTAWGLTQVRSTAIAAGTALLIDPMAVSVLDRQQVAAYMTDSHASQFVSGILTLMLEARMGLALFDPAGVCKVTFNGTA